MTEIKYYKVTKITEQELVQAREIATKNNCIVRLLWQLGNPINITQSKQYL